ncbi:MAG: hypothetical protein HQK49_11045 [Oligoflexia bacterium]|nr:hypothetical protein [Oligoflexia bacterium]
MPRLLLLLLLVLLFLFQNSFIALTFALDEKLKSTIEDARKSGEKLGSIGIGVAKKHNFLKKFFMS